jgi:uncharacterized protein YqcC (DUF446 family)
MFFYTMELLAAVDRGLGDAAATSAGDDAHEGVQLQQRRRRLQRLREELERAAVWQKCEPSTGALSSEALFALKLIDTEGGPQAMERLLDAMSKGISDRVAVEQVMKRKWPEFEKNWMAYLKKQPFPKELIPPSSFEKKELTEARDDKKKAKKGREVSFGDFAEVKENDARRDAHLGELFRERNRMKAAAEAYARAYKVVGTVSGARDRA